MSTSTFTFKSINSSSEESFISPDFDKIALAQMSRGLQWSEDKRAYQVFGAIRKKSWIKKTLMNMRFLFSDIANNPPKTPEDKEYTEALPLLKTYLQEARRLNPGYRGLIDCLFQETPPKPHYMKYITGLRSTGTFKSNELIFIDEFKLPSVEEMKANTFYIIRELKKYTVVATPFIEIVKTACYTLTEFHERKEIPLTSYIRFIEPDYEKSIQSILFNQGYFRTHSRFILLNRFVYLHDKLVNAYKNLYTTPFLETINELVLFAAQLIARLDQPCFNDLADKQQQKDFFSNLHRLCLEGYKIIHSPYSHSLAFIHEEEDDYTWPFDYQVTNNILWTAYYKYLFQVFLPTIHYSTHHLSDPQWIYLPLSLTEKNKFNSIVNKLTHHTPILDIKDIPSVFLDHFPNLFPASIYGDIFVNRKKDIETENNLSIETGARSVPSHLTTTSSSSSTRPSQSSSTLYHTPTTTTTSSTSSTESKSESALHFKAV